MAAQAARGRQLRWPRSANTRQPTGNRYLLLRPLGNFKRGYLTVPHDLERSHAFCSSVPRERSTRSSTPQNGKFCCQVMPFHWNAEAPKAGIQTCLFGGVRSRPFPIGGTFRKTPRRMRLHVYPTASAPIASTRRPARQKQRRQRPLRPSPSTIGSEPALLAANGQPRDIRSCGQPSHVQHLRALPWSTAGRVCAVSAHAVAAGCIDRRKALRAR